MRICYHRQRRDRRRYILFSVRGWLIWLISMGIASLTCVLLRTISTSDVHVPMIFVLAVLIVSLFTDGYFYGILAAVTSVFMVNYAFTFPYAKLDFSGYGYPLTSLTMLAVGVVISALMTRVKEQEELRVQARGEKMRADLLRSLSHDLRTPLTSINGALTAVLEDPLLTEEEKRVFLGGAQQDVEWLYRVVENLLTITRIEGVEISKLQRDEELLEEIISSAVSNFRKHESGIAVHVQMPAEVLFVKVDPLLIEQVLLNLFYNTAQHGRTAADIWVSVKDVGTFVEVSVADNGRGMPEETKAHLFDGALAERSRRTDSTRGMGIGLTVCKAIIEAHGGTIKAGDAQSGACILFTLPKGGLSDGDQG